MFEKSIDFTFSWLENKMHGSNMTIHSDIHWVYKDQTFNVTARFWASQNSFALGKHNWTVAVFNVVFTQTNNEYRM